MRSVLLSPRWLVRHAVAIVLIAACFGLAWWQWGRAHSLTGTAQNLGYALQWPAFGAFVAYAWYRMLRLELHPPSEKTETEKSEADAPAEPGRRTVAVRRRYQPVAPPPEPPADSADSADEEALATYNAYLAALNKSSESGRTAP
ncbi:hypothetical protein [Cryptosporangium phraense]|uniref:Uncharacterized protein n=1 Tax=Cryptosporangium phraense TaxID=2593070 RepID=A0A545ASZ0_9ACTN|nr:hypothetical protein [Cryptosporangium phraense]TQS44467.1 hypothetical protein FL583_13445 [Cryptosporangium phraense]